MRQVSGGSSLNASGRVPTRPSHSLRASFLLLATLSSHGDLPAEGRVNGTQNSLPPTVPSASVPVFDVASIRIDKSEESARSHIISSPNDSHFRAINVTLKSLLQWAYTIPDTRIVGGPAWLGSTKFDIDAKADPSVDDQMRGLSSEAGRLQKQKMLQALLADRFQLKLHQETRELPIYALVLAKGGPKFQPSQINGTTVDSRRGEISVKGSDDTIALLADALARSLDRVVVNESGIHGRFELDLKWSPDPGAAGLGPSGSGASAADPALPSIFTAIQEQLGLKLEPKKGPVSVLVLDRLDLPSEN
jgi:uncharacterized protein (TIGR03435 family)